MYIVTHGPGNVTAYRTTPSEAAAEAVDAAFRHYDLPDDQRLAVIDAVRKFGELRDCDEGYLRNFALGIRDLMELPVRLPPESLPSVDLGKALNEATASHERPHWSQGLRRARWE